STCALVRILGIDPPCSRRHGQRHDAPPRQMVDVNSLDLHRDRLAVKGTRCHSTILCYSPLDRLHPTATRHGRRAAIQLAFSFFVLTETRLAPVEGWVAGRRRSGLRHVRTAPSIQRRPSWRTMNDRFLAQARE